MSQDDDVERVGTAIRCALYDAQFWRHLVSGDFVAVSNAMDAAARISEMDAEIKRLREAMLLIANRPTNIPIDPHGMAQFARAALEHQQKGDGL